MSELALTLEQCEAEIEKAQEAAKDHFAVIGAHLAIIRDGKLYEPTYDSFGSYCRDRWDFSANYARRLVNAVKVLEEIRPENVPIGTSEIDQPQTESQVREIAKSSDSPKVRKQIWETATTISENPTAAVIQKAAAIVTGPGGGESAEIDAAVAQLVKLTTKITECGKRVQLAIEAKVKASKAMERRKVKFQKRIDNLAEQVEFLTTHVNGLDEEWQRVKKQVDD